MKPEPEPGAALELEPGQQEQEQARDAPADVGDTVRNGDGGEGVEKLESDVEVILVLSGSQLALRCPACGASFVRKEWIQAIIPVIRYLSHHSHHQRPVDLHRLRLQ